MESPVRRRAFSLTEIVVVVVIVGVLAAVAIPRLTQASENAKAKAAAASRRTIEQVIQERFATTGAFPSAVKGEWFVNGELPSNPYAVDGSGTGIYVDTSADVSTLHPTSKLATTYSWWYNPNNGTIRALVDADRDTDTTLRTYNRINETDISDLGQTTVK